MSEEEADPLIGGGSLEPQAPRENSQEKLTQETISSPSKPPPDREASTMSNSEKSPGDVYKFCMQMDDILDKLRLLNYEKEAMKASGALRKAISQWDLLFLLKIHF